MSNCLNIVCTKFVNLDEEHNPDGVQYGYRVFNDHDKTYENFVDEEVVREALHDPQKCLKMVRDTCDTQVGDMLDDAKFLDETLNINGMDYDAEEWTHWE